MSYVQFSSIRHLVSIVRNLGEVKRSIKPTICGKSTRMERYDDFVYVHVSVFRLFDIRGDKTTFFQFGDIMKKTAI